MQFGECLKGQNFKKCQKFAAAIPSFFSRKLKGNLFSVGNQSDFIDTKMSDQWQEFRCTCTGEEVGQNKVSSVDLGDLIKIDRKY